MRIYAGLKPDDWRHWGEFTTIKTNAAQLLRKQLRENQIIYCSPLVDPYQPAEEEVQLMPRLLEAVLSRPPRIFVIQTRGPLILRDLTDLVKLSKHTSLRVSFSITTNRDEVRRLYEPHCAAIGARLDAIRQLRAAGIQTFATIAPILPCDPDDLAARALEATDQNVIGDPLHVRAVKPHGATTREAALRLSKRKEFSAWLDPDFQAEVTARIGAVIEKAGRKFATGTEGFRWLSQ